MRRDPDERAVSPSHDGQRPTKKTGRDQTDGETVSHSQRTTSDQAEHDDPRIRGGARYEIWKLDDLKPFPLQDAYFEDVGGEAFERFVEDIRRKGVEAAPEILPAGNAAGFEAGTLIRGHQRVRALEHIGEKTVRVLVRYDLAKADAMTIEEAFLSDNAHRRQLDQLSLARVARRLFELQQSRERGELRSRDVEKARAHIGKLLGIGSAKTLSRLWSILTTPREVQDAFRASKLPIVIAARIATLDRDAQRKIALRLRKGEKPTDVVADFLPSTVGSRHVKPRDAWRSTVRLFETALVDLEDRIDDVPIIALAKHRSLLDRVHEFIEDLRERADKPQPPDGFGDFQVPPHR